MNKNTCYVSKEDEAFISKMKNLCISENELIFFSKMDEKMHNEPAPANDLILSEHDNKDGLYIVRCYDSEFLVGKHLGDYFAEEYHAMSLVEAFACNLQEKGLLDRNITLHEWLRECDYSGIQYNHNYDFVN